VKKLLEFISCVIGLREVLLISGFVALGYGLYLFRPWISFAACGSLLIVGGLFFMKAE
jgi:hypothetical protein